ncbi:hypothetical protein [Alicyclobacillus fastidiosus]|uniref:hypothetical protein n=1 Tax=Alicyclobacillus fastidiosus TaxID=392011 RepID=UPI0023E8FDE8|nr:hypothetical protein [Alicyclobacillus fastidiosus]GMA65952.1 hypothetical protein GCM10025859_63940 [Alicyclobacillus fastidiosus]GMA66172.1 hypothetical protein GCM10025859_66140 [Alicyclobacillus fastidiosus]
MGKREDQLTTAYRPVEINAEVKPAKTGRVRLSREEFTKRRQEVEAKREQERAHA